MPRAASPIGFGLWGRTGALFRPTSNGTLLAEGKELARWMGSSTTWSTRFARHRDDQGRAGDRWGDLNCREVARNVGPVMAAAAVRTVASVFRIKELGELGYRAQHGRGGQ